MSDKRSTAVEIIKRETPASGMSPIVEIGLGILKENPSPETLRELLAVQREYEANEARKAYAAALVGLKRDLPTVIDRDKVVDFTSQKGRTRYTHSSLAGVMDAITGPLTQHGFSLTWRPSTGQGTVSVACRLSHSAGHCEETSITAPIDTSGSKSPAQGVASTITLLQRYTALSLLGIATADMHEPQGEKDEVTSPVNGDKIDSSRNLKMVGWLKQQGRSREDAEKLIGRKVPEWTAADLERLRAWAWELASAKGRAAMGEPNGPEPPISPDEPLPGSAG